MDQAVRSSKITPTPPTAAIDPQLSPDGQLFAFCVMGEIFVGSCHECHPPIQVTFGADIKNAVTHGLADFVAQEEMDRYRGFWWSMDSKGIVFVRVDESKVPPYRITHHECETMSDSCMFEDHRYPFAGKANPSVRLAFVRIDADSLVRQQKKQTAMTSSSSSSGSNGPSTSSRDAQKIAQRNWNDVTWFDPPREAAEYLARLDFLPDGCACAQWQNRTQNCLVLVRMNLETGKTKTLLVERSDVWINLHHLLHVLDRPIHPMECQNIDFQPPLPNPLPEGSFSFLFGSERSGYSHLYLYTFVPGVNGDQAMLIRQVSFGDWVVESIAGVSLQHNAVYVTGTYDSALERHLYALPLISFESDSSTDTWPMETEESTSGNPHNGMRRGFKQVMNALSGKSQILSQDGHGHASSHNKYMNSSNVASSGSSASSAGQMTTQFDSITPVRLTTESGMHNVVMDPDCSRVVDTSSDLGRPTTVKLFEIPEGGPFASIIGSFHQNDDSRQGNSPTGAFLSRSRMYEMRLQYTLYDALRDDTSMEISNDSISNLPAPELMTFPSSDGTESLHAALYRPEARIHGPGPYPLICAVYGGPHVQRVNRSWSQCADMRAQRLRSLGFCVVKCDNRGSSRRGLAFESAISRRLGRLEVLDQVAVVRQLSVRGIADPTRVGIYGWSYGGYLAAMCLCRAPDVFHCAVAGAPVTSWDGYDTHYTERYMGLPSENPSGYRESAVFDHIPNMRGKLLLVHGLIDENVHFRHTARLINRLIAAGKDYDLLLFPDERHSPRRLRDRIYMEQRISDYFLKHLTPLGNSTPVRTIAGL
jgi:dienelactone hydrolase